MPPPEVKAHDQRPAAAALPEAGRDRGGGVGTFAGGDYIVGQQDGLDVQELALEFLGPAFGIVEGGLEFLDVDGQPLLDGLMDVNEMAGPQRRGRAGI